jgi:hypothetical protein
VNQILSILPPFLTVASYVIAGGGTALLALSFYQAK